LSTKRKEAGNSLHIKSQLTEARHNSRPWRSGGITLEFFRKHDFTDTKCYTVLSLEIYPYENKQRAHGLWHSAGAHLGVGTIRGNCSAGMSRKNCTSKERPGECPRNVQETSRGMSRGMSKECPGECPGECPDHQAGLQVSTSSGYNFCHHG